jgi:LuxR family maltose regulon positive regulatory protein
VDDQARAIRGTVAVWRANIARFRGDLAYCVSLSQQALDLLPPTALVPRMGAMLSVASAFRVSGEVSLTNEHLLAAAVARASDSGLPVSVLRARTILAEMRRRQGRLRQAAAAYHEALEALPEPAALPAMPNGADYYAGLGDLLREWNDLDAAETLLTQGQKMVRGTLPVEADAVAAGYIGLAHLQQTRGEWHAALATLAEFEQVARERNFADHLISRCAATRARLALVQGDLQTAARWADTSDLRTDGDLSYPRESEFLSLARVRLAQGYRDPVGPYLHEVRRLLTQLLAHAEACERIDSVIEISVLHALALQAQGDLRGALTALSRALALAAPEGYVRIFVDEGAPMALLLAQILAEGGTGTDLVQANLLQYAAKLLDVFQAEGLVPPIVPDRPAPTSRYPIPSLLTERELEVLRLLAAGHSNRAIAEKLIVAVGTVKRHVSNIMDKLQAESRLEVVARARDLDLL